MAQRDIQQAANPGSGSDMDKPYDDDGINKPYEWQMIDGVLPLPWLSWIHPNYRSTSTKTITGMIKFPHLSPYNFGSPTTS
jgi:hypothetical protein